MICPVLAEKTYRSFTALASYRAKLLELEVMMSVFGVPESNPIPVGQAGFPPSERDARLMEAAQALEASFLSEMLKAAGVDAAPSVFGGGIGEEQFSSFLRDAQARDIVRAGGIGLAESLFEAMQAREDV